MSDYKIENREEATNVLVGRVCESAPLRELIRVYSEAVTNAVQGLSDADLARSIFAAGYADIAEAFNIAEPPAPEAELEAEGAEVSEGEAVLA
jgi:hypothetical protein